MNLSELCIRRPVFTTLLTATFIVFGIFGYRLLPVAALPAVEYPTIVITAQLQGASAESMASSVAAPIERQLSTISGISSLTSTSTLGRSKIVIQFLLDRNIDGAALDVQTALTVAAKRLPVEMTTPPSFNKTNPADQPVVLLAASSATAPISVVDEYAETILGQQISQLPGISEVEVYGSQKYATRIQVDPVAAAARGIALDDVRKVLAATDSNTPVGTLYGPKQNVTLVATNAMRKADEYKQVVVAWRNGAPVKLEEIATIVDSVENNQVASWFNDLRAVVLAIHRQPGANTIEVVNEIRDLLPAYRAQVPAAINLEILADRSISIRDSVQDVEVTLMIAVTLVILVIFLFLRSVSATVIPALAVPVSLIGTCAIMYALNFSINNMTLLALTLSVGFVVDDAIVMLENIVRHVEGGMRPFEAALKGSREIGFTILSITFSLIAVFIPVLLMGGIVGRVFREFAVTIAVTILISGLVSLTLTPMLCARVLNSHHDAAGQNVILRAFERFFRGLMAAYGWALDKVLKYKTVTLAVTIATLIGTGYLYVAIPKGFFPSEDTGFISATTEAATDISFPAMVVLQNKVVDIIVKDKAVDYVNPSVGPGGLNPTPNSGRVYIALKPRAERGENSTAVIQRLRRTANVVPGMTVTFQNVQNINITGRVSKSEYQYSLQSSDTKALYELAPQMRDRIAKVDGIRDVNTDLYINNPQMAVDIDREKAAVYGITIDQIRQEMFNCFGTRQAATIYTATNDYQVILECKPEFQTDISALSRIYLKTATGMAVPLASVTRLVSGVGPISVNHQANQPSVTISFNLAPGYSIGQAVDAISAIERDMRLPASVSTGFQGAAAVFQDSLKGQGVLVLAAIFAAYVLLGVLYESFIHPITIISGLPSAGVGALLTLILAGMDLSVIAMIGIVMLVGIVKKNAIMMIDFAIERRRIGMSAEAAMREACLLRFRPIMMTTFAAIFGALPIAVGAGAGAELRQPLGIAVVGGLCVSQFLTLFITPVIYIYLDRIDRMLKRRLDPQLEEVPELHPRPEVVAAE
ncbi:MAG TPA: efflux RND transporter permease subunit [Xanthobacteraceae bacterium]|jgi:HAE1 family hydrophobic/amphiphilic exporter-1|nr:efflux RND transporter permease subunit [Xanthobacteraceae bacterium]